MIDACENSKKIEDLNFDNLVHCFSLPLYLYAKKNMHNNIEAEDIVQDCLVKLWEKRSKFNTIISIKSYLYAMVRNECFTRLKGKNIVEYHDNYSDSIYDNSLDENEYNKEFDVIELLLYAIETLPPQYKKIMKLVIKGLNNNEIAQELGVAENSVRVMKVRSLKKIRKIARTDALMLLLSIIK